MILSLEELRRQCRIGTDNTGHDEQLTLLCLAAQSRVEKMTGKKLYNTEAEKPDEDLTGIVLEESVDIKLALLLLVAHYFDNPSATSDRVVHTVPFAFDDLVSLHLPY